MLSNLLIIGLRPIVAGAAVLVTGAVAGWGMSRYEDFLPVRLVRAWVERVVIVGVRSRSWARRTIFIFANNSVVCAALVLLGALPAGAWVAITLVGLSMGAAMQVLGSRHVEGRRVRQLEGDAGDGSDRRETNDWPTIVGLALNLIEVPAILLTLGLAMCQRAAPVGLPTPELWRMFLALVLPALLVSACGESLWLGRKTPFAA